MGSNRFMVLLASVYFFSTTWVTAEGSTDPGTDFLDQKEAQLTFLKNEVEDNYRRKCELLRTCGTPINCSRHSCSPLALGDVKNYLTCKEVIYNAYCTSCHSKYFDFTRSYVRLAPTTNIASTDTAATICSQRVLDAAFKNVTNENSLSRAFLGTVDGAYIHFPGSDQSSQDCGQYDPRSRPWYRASITVKKAVMVLVDGGAMKSALPTPLNGTFLNLAHDIVADLLNTLSDQDVVNIITYDSSKAISLAPSPVDAKTYFNAHLVENATVVSVSQSNRIVQVGYNVAADSTSHPEFAGLIGSLSNAVSSGGSSNITFGITAALDNFSGYGTYMKVIIVFTDGNTISFQNNGSLSALVGKNVKVFVFKLPHQDDTPTPTASPFLTQLQGLGGIYNIITSAEVNNRLYSILPYFTFLAKFRASVDDSPDYSLIYKDYEHVVDNIFSITKPAFADDGRLLGIVGLNIFLDGLGNITKSVTDALAGRNGGKAFDPSKFVLTAANASIQNGTNPSVCNGSSIQLPSNAGLCARNDTVSSIKDLTCCGACSGANSKLRFIGIGVGFVASVVVVVLTAYLVRRRRRERQIIHLQYPGDVLNHHG